MDYTERVYDSSNSASLSMVKVFAWMFLGLLVTGVVAFFLPVVLVQTNSAGLYTGLLIGSSILCLVLCFAIQLTSLGSKSGKTSAVLFMIYAAAMGTMLSSVVLSFASDLQVISYAFLTTAGCFGVMALYGLISKRNLSSLGMIGIMLLLGSLILTVINLIARVEGIYWIVSYVTLGAMLLITAFDLNRMKHAANAGKFNTGIAVYFAFNLYIDFIYIFIRVLAIVASSRNN